MQKSSQTLRQSKSLQTEVSIQEYIDYFTDFVQTLIDNTISWVKLSQYDQAWWTSESEKQCKKNIEQEEHEFVHLMSN